jgi:cytochrome c oxidase assembly protein subunit 15
MIWIGGLVTTYRAGMAAPEGFSTYGYPLFTYPVLAWLAAPWDLFIEHGHRLWGYLVGISTIAFVLATWNCDPRRWMRWLAIAALLGVIGQGVLGAMRVHFDEVLLARIHGCVGPAFFAFAVALAVLTSRRWVSSEPPELLAKGAALQRLALVTTGLAYLQIVLGSALRHMPVWASPGDFRTALVFHLVVALALAVHIVWLLVRVFKIARRQSALLRPAVGLAALLLVQLGLGLGTWVAKYGWPTIVPDWLAPGGQLDYTVVAEGRLQAWLTTAHVAAGSLILVTSLLVSLRSLRLVRGASQANGHVARLMELAV